MNLETPGAETPSPAAAPAANDEIAEILGLGSTPSPAPENGGTTPPEPPASGAVPSPSEAGGGEPAPSPPVTPPPAGETPPAPAAPAPTEGTPQGGTPPSPAPSAPPAAAPQPSPDEGALKTASLEATVAALQAEVERLRASPQPATGATAPQPAAALSPEQPAGEQPYRYALTLLKPIQDALLSEDPAQNISAIQTITNDLGTIVHNTVLAQVRSEMRGMFDRLAGMATEARTGESREQATEAGRQAYFSKFPAHKNDLILPIISSENAKLAAAYPNAPFDDNYQNALGARVNAALEAIGAKPSGGDTTPPAVQPNTPPARPAAMLPNGPRSAAPTAPNDLGEDIMATLDPFSGG